MRLARLVLQSKYIAANDKFVKTSSAIEQKLLKLQKAKRNGHTPRQIQGALHNALNTVITSKSPEKLTIASTLLDELLDTAGGSVRTSEGPSVDTELALEVSSAITLAQTLKALRRYKDQSGGRKALLPASVVLGLASKFYKSDTNELIDECHREVLLSIISCISVAAPPNGRALPTQEFMNIKAVVEVAVTGKCSVANMDAKTDPQVVAALKGLLSPATLHCYAIPTAVSALMKARRMKEAIIPEDAVQLLMRLNGAARKEGKLAADSLPTSAIFGLIDSMGRKQATVPGLVNAEARATLAHATSLAIGPMSPQAACMLLVRVATLLDRSRSRKNANSFQNGSVPMPPIITNHVPVREAVLVMEVAARYACTSSHPSPNPSMAIALCSSIGCFDHALAYLPAYLEVQGQKFGTLAQSLQPLPIALSGYVAYLAAKTVPEVQTASECCETLRESIPVGASECDSNPGATLAAAELLASVLRSDACIVANCAQPLSNVLSWITTVAPLKLLADAEIDEAHTAKLLRERQGIAPGDAKLASGTRLYLAAYSQKTEGRTAIHSYHHRRVVSLIAAHYCALKAVAGAPEAYRKLVEDRDSAVVILRLLISPCVFASPKGTLLTASYSIFAGETRALLECLPKDLRADLEVASGAVALSTQTVNPLPRPSALHPATLESILCVLPLRHTINTYQTRRWLNQCLLACISSGISAPILSRSHVCKSIARSLAFEVELAVGSDMGTNKQFSDSFAHRLDQFRSKLGVPLAGIEEDIMRLRNL